MELTFDRGTLLLDAPEGDAVFAETGALTWDSRVGAWRAPASAYAGVTSGLSGRGVRFSDAVRRPSDVPEVERPPLRPYQEAALGAWESAACRGVIALPTGAGKTRVAIAGIAAARARTIVLVPTRVLLDQWERELAAVAKSPIGRLGDGERRIESITVATYESAYRHMAEIGNEFDLLIADETHHFGSGLRDEALEMCVAPMRMGLTATPSQGEAWDKVTSSLIGPVVYQLTIGDLVGTWLAGLDMSTITLDLERDERAAYEGWMAEFHRVTGALRDALGPHASWKDLARMASRSAQGRDALAAFRSAQRLVALTAQKRVKVGELLRTHRDNRVLIFTADNESAYELARERLVMPITCDIGRPEREAVLAKFRAGELRALVSARVLNEGIDVPDADVAIIVGAALGEREYVQRIGRLLRPAPGKRATVYELVTRRTIEVRRAKKRRGAGATRQSAAAQT